MYEAKENVIGCRRFMDVEAGALRNLKMPISRLWKVNKQYCRY
jgi:hypothetical protein